MTNSGLIVFLPLIAAPATDSGPSVFLPLVAAFVGAIIGAWANSWYREREAKKARDQEREGLLILLFIEVSSNYRSLQPADRIDNVIVPRIFADQRGHSLADFAARLHTEVWDETKVRLALLLSDEEIMLLVNYYALIERIRRQLTMTSPNDELPEMLEKREYGTRVDIRRLREDSEGVIRLMQNHISNPAFAASLLDKAGFRLPRK
jgi:hypothetical protein